MRPALFAQVASLEARKALSYRAAFVLHMLVALVTGFAVPYYLWQAIFEARATDRIAGFTHGSMVLYYVCVMMIGRVVRGPDMGLGLAREIYDGALTRYLVYPVHYGVFKYAQHLGALLPSLWQAVVFTALFALVLELPPDLVVTPGNVALALIALWVANLVHFLLTLPVLGIAFWADNVWSLAVFLRMVTSLLGGQMVPLTLFPDWSQSILAWLPFGCFFDLPVRTLMGQVPPGLWLRQLLVAIVWGAVFALLARWVWRRGELRYTGVGI